MRSNTLAIVDHPIGKTQIDIGIGRRINIGVVIRVQTNTIRRAIDTYH